MLKRKVEGDREDPGCRDWGQLVNEVGCQMGLWGSSAKHPGSWRTSAPRTGRAAQRPYLGRLAGLFQEAEKAEDEIKWPTWGGLPGEECCREKPWAGNN